MQPPVWSRKPAGATPPGSTLYSLDRKSSSSLRRPQEGPWHTVRLCRTDSVLIEG